MNAASWPSIPDAPLAEFVTHLALKRAATGAGLASIFFSRAMSMPDELAARWPNTRPACAMPGARPPARSRRTAIARASMLAMLFPADRFEAAAAMIENISQPDMEEVVDKVSQLAPPARADDATGRDDNLFAVLLVDGMSRAEEAITSALYWSLDDIPLVGGSAGDNMHFEQTSLILNGKVAADCAIVILVRLGCRSTSSSRRTSFPPPKAGRDGLRSGPAHRPRVQRRARRRGLCRRHRPRSGALDPDELRLAPGRGPGRRRILLPLDPEACTRTARSPSSAPSTTASC